MSLPAVISPSYKRATLARTHLIYPEVVYCVSEKEVDEYIDQGLSVMECPNEAEGNIARKRNWILDQYRDEDVLLIDDDIEHIARWVKDEDDYRPKRLNPEEIDDLINEGFHLCKEFGARLWGIQMLTDRFSYSEAIPFGLKSFISGAFSGFIKPELRYDESIPLKEDYDMQIQQCNKYRKLLRLNMFNMKKNDHLNKGGCAVYRTTLREQEQFDLFRLKWGSKIVQTDKGGKKNKAKKKQFDINPVIKIPINGI